ncbi:hypothetical protein HK100_008150 [Physocladia obscura]|uniref:SUN domain-containing protein n=1 Tax=Physocladia obscura TaxID=109957 RepID=A0AAD5TA41_9FUNG|nr:hypothetical protein HK100_008150 [Physocladia obscura]
MSTPQRNNINVNGNINGEIYGSGSASAGDGTSGGGGRGGRRSGTTGSGSVRRATTSGATDDVNDGSSSYSLTVLARTPRAKLPIPAATPTRRSERVAAKHANSPYRYPSVAAPTGSSNTPSVSASDSSVASATANNTIANSLSTANNNTSNNNSNSPIPDPSATPRSARIPRAARSSFNNGNDNNPRSPRASRPNPRSDAAIQTYTNNDSDATLDGALSDDVKDDKENLNGLQSSPWETVKNAVASISPIRLFSRPKRPAVYKQNAKTESSVKFSDDDSNNTDDNDDREKYADEEDNGRNDSDADADDDDDDDDDDVVVVETIQIQYDDDNENLNELQENFDVFSNNDLNFDVDSQSNQFSSLNSPAIISTSALHIFAATTFSILSDYIITPFNSIILHILSFYKSLASASKIIILLITLSATSTAIIYHRPEFQRPVAIFANIIPTNALSNINIPQWSNVSSVLAYAVAKPNAAILDWYNTVVVGSLSRLAKVTSGAKDSVAKHGFQQTSKFLGSAVNQSNEVVFSFWNKTKHIANEIQKRVKGTLLPDQVRNYKNGFKIKPPPEPVKYVDITEAQALATRIEHLEASLKQVHAGFQTSSKSFDMISSDTRSLYGAVESTGLSIAGLEATVAALENEISAGGTRHAATVSQIQSIEEKLQAVVNQIAGVKIHLISNENAFKNDVLKLIEDKVPTMMLAKQDAKTGQIFLDPAFLAYLKQKIIVTPASSSSSKPIINNASNKPTVSETRIQELITSKIADATKSLVSSSQVDSLVHDLLAEGFETFQKTHIEARLANFAASVKVDFGTTLQREITDALASAASTAATSAESAVSTAAKTAAAETALTIEAALEKQSREYLAKSRELVNEFLSGDDGDASNEGSKVILTRDQVIKLLDVEINNAKAQIASKIDARFDGAKNEATRLDAEALKDVMDTLIQNAFTKYVADGIGREDFALEANGGYIVRDLTSASFTLPSDTSFGRAMGHRVRVGYSPMIAITEGVSPGKCWATEGPTGTLGIHFASPVIPTSFTIDHVPKEVLLDNRTVKSAPKNVELWIVLTNDLAAFKKMDLNSPAVRQLPRTGGEKKTDQSIVGLLVSQQTFDPSVSNVQTFAVDKEAIKAIEKLGIVPKVAVLRITSNWGNPDFTCLYRVRIHGRD